MSSSRCAPHVVIGVAICALASCAELERPPSPELGTEPPREPANAPSSAELDQAVAHVRPLGGGEGRGTLELTQTSTGVVVVAEIRGLTPGRHAVHVHAAESCDAARGFARADECMAPAPDAEPEREATGGGEGTSTPTSGRCVVDLGVVEPNADGGAVISSLVPDVSVERGVPGTLLGHVVVVHRWGDEAIVDPAARPGPSIACGVIGRTAPRA